MRNATRHEIVSTRMPPMNGPRMVVAAVAAAHTPYARPWASPVKFAVSSASEPGTRIAPAAPCRKRDCHNGRIDEDDRRAEHGGDQRPALSAAHDMRSPASMLTASLFPGGASGQTHFGS